MKKILLFALGFNSLMANAQTIPNGVSDAVYKCVDEYSLTLPGKGLKSLQAQFKVYVSGTQFEFDQDKNCQAVRPYSWSSNRMMDIFIHLTPDECSGFLQRTPKNVASSGRWGAAVYVCVGSRDRAGYYTLSNARFGAMSVPGLRRNDRPCPGESEMAEVSPRYGRWVKGQSIPDLTAEECKTLLIEKTWN